jgi:hypothetical protein
MGLDFSEAGQNGALVGSEPMVQAALPLFEEGDKRLKEECSRERQPKLKAGYGLVLANDVRFESGGSL